MSPAEITQQLGLQSLTRRAWVSQMTLISILPLTHLLTPTQFIQSTCATTGDGLYEGLEWLANALKKAGHDWRIQDEMTWDTISLGLRCCVGARNMGLVVHVCFKKGSFFFISVLASIPIFKQPFLLSHPLNFSLPSLSLVSLSVPFHPSIHPSKKRKPSSVSRDLSNRSS